MKVRAKAAGFYGSLREVGDEFVIKSEEDLGLWMEPVGDSGDSGSTAGHKAKHNGGGRFIVVDSNDQRVGEFSGSKEEAEAEAKRLDGDIPNA